MDEDKRKLREINDVTYHSKKIYQERVKAVLDAEEDIEQKKRILSCECKLCYYIYRQRLAGSAFTKWKCRGCDKTFNHHNTNVPKFCRDCSELYRVCITCGGDLNLAARRRNLTYDR